jgi:hypothetical protein
LEGQQEIKWEWKSAEGYSGSLKDAFQYISPLSDFNGTSVFHLFPFYIFAVVSTMLNVIQVAIGADGVTKSAPPQLWAVFYWFSIVGLVLTVLIAGFFGYSDSELWQTSGFMP